MSYNGGTPSSGTHRDDGGDTSTPNAIWDRVVPEVAGLPVAAAPATSPALDPPPPISPALHQLDGGGAQDAVRQQVDLLHDVGEADGQLLPQEGEGGLLAGIAGAWQGGDGQTDGHGLNPSLIPPSLRAGFVLAAPLVGTGGVLGRLEQRRQEQVPVPGWRGILEGLGGLGGSGGHSSAHWGGHAGSPVQPRLGLGAPPEGNWEGRRT